MVPNHFYEVKYPTIQLLKKQIRHNILFEIAQNDICLGASELCVLLQRYALWECCQYHWLLFLWWCQSNISGIKKCPYNKHVVQGSNNVFSCLIFCFVMLFRLLWLFCLPIKRKFWVAEMMVKLPNYFQIIWKEFGTKKAKVHYATKTGKIKKRCAYLMCIT